MSKSKNMIISEYVLRKGLACPVCRSVDLQGQDVNISEGEATQDVSCDECGATWTDVYILQSYRSLEPGEPDE